MIYQFSIVSIKKWFNLLELDYSFIAFIVSDFLKSLFNFNLETVPQNGQAVTVKVNMKRWDLYFQSVFEY